MNTKKTNIKISVISPVYGAEASLEELVRQITLNISKITDDYEIILIDDFSPDNSWNKITELCKVNKSIRAFRFSRNFGQHLAIKAGIQKAKGDIAIVMDCDLQDNPVYFLEMYQKFQKGYDIIYTYKKSRKHSFIKNITANIFNKIFNYLIDSKNLQASNNIGSFSLISRPVMEQFLNFNDYQFHYLLVLRWLGFSSVSIEIEHLKRIEGKSSYTLTKLIDHAFIAIIYQSDKLLRLTLYSGVVIATLSLLFGFFIIIQSFFTPFQAGWASVIVLILFSLGTILFSIGIIGLYLGKVFEQVKHRPQYIIEKQIEEK